MPKGVLIFRGMKAGFLPGDLVISLSEEGGFDSRAVLSTAYNVLPLWLRVAHDAVDQAKNASDAIAANWSDDAETNKELLIAELTPALQVFVSCGIALDALYDQLRPYANLDDEQLEKWRKNRTSRAKQVAEVIRRVYNLDATVHAKATQIISEVMKWRDQAVHPSLELKNSCARPDIPVGVDWKFSVYRSENCSSCFRSVRDMLVYLITKGCSETAVNDHMQTVFEALQELGVVSGKPDVGDEA